MKPGAWLFSSGRGEVADTAALKRAAGLGGMVLDVWENEPEIDRELLSRVRIGTPHIAGYSTDGKANGTAMSVRALAKFFDLPKLAEWRPAELPAPREPQVIELDSRLPEAEQVAAALRHSYDIRLDDQRLRDDPAGFETQRGDYRIRREAPAFAIRGGGAEARASLLRIGFRTV
ncbi:Erythronate-4-phosphate dehydrogenase [bioreactor metagenome]|uniref:Erythronate-4-phosphate dehydrogenase n=1 Tax=bioreactor metagenome TaxID=1076179 RepID=A0A645ENB3_9ZZZZ